MAEYIKKEDIEQKIQDGLKNLVLGHDAIEVLGMIYEMPAADVAPVRHGRWIQCKYMDKSAQCSECGGYYTRFSVNERYPNYCPHCGCKMDLED